MFVRRTASRGIVLALALGLLATLSLTPSSQGTAKSGVLSIVHLAPGTEDPAVVDVFANDQRIVNNLKLAQLRGVRLPARKYIVTIYQDGNRPGNGTPLLQENALQLKTGSNITVALYRTAEGVLTSQTFDNDTLRNAKGEGRLTIRHIAVAPEVKVRLEGGTLVVDLANSQQASVRLPAGTRLLEVFRADDDAVLVQARQIPVNRPMNTIVYVWGSTDEGLRLASQRVNIGKP
jgi:hypothetical protein